MGKHFFPVPGENPLSPKCTERRRENEVRVVLSMMEMYCRAQKHDHRQHCRMRYDVPKVVGEKKDRFLSREKSYRLCPSCREKARILIHQTTNCPHMAYKTFCHECPRPCHPPDPYIAEVMRYSGPRLLFLHPVLAIQNLRYVIHRRYLLRHDNKEES